jgi:hypothetical protein
MSVTPCLVGNTLEAILELRDLDREVLILTDFHICEVS